MKKYLFLFFAVIAFTISAYANKRDTCTIEGGNGASVVAEASGTGHSEVYFNFYNDASSYVNMTVHVKVEQNGVSSYSASGSKTFLVKPGESTGTVKLDGVNWSGNSFTVTGVTVSGARCSR